MSGIGFLTNCKTLIATQGMLPKWLRWQARRVGFEPKVCVDSKSAIRGFRSFSEYWSSGMFLPSPSERAFLVRYIPSSGIIFDVGANLGVFTVILADLRPKSVVHAFEPSPVTFSRLVRNVRANNLANVSCYQLAVGARTTTSRFSADPASPATNRFILADETNESHANEVEVRVVTLDGFAAENQVREIAFLKADVEGFEADVIRGGSSVFRKKGVLMGLLELCPGNLKRLRRSEEDLLETVAELGYELRFITSDGRLGKVVNVVAFRSVTLSNAALLPRGTA